MTDMKYYGYKVGIYNEETGDYFVDRGVVKAYDYTDTTDKLSKEFADGDMAEVITSIELWELDEEEMNRDVFSIYTFLADSTEKNQLVNELKNWHLI